MHKHHDELLKGKDSKEESPDGKEEGAGPVGDAGSSTDPPRPVSVLFHITRLATSNPQHRPCSYWQGSF